MEIGADDVDADGVNARFQQHPGAVGIVYRIDKNMQACGLLNR